MRCSFGSCSTCRNITPARAARAAHQGDVRVRYAPPVVEPTIGTSPRYRRRQRHVQLTRGVAGHLDRGEVFRVRRVSQPVNLRLPSQGRQRDDGVVQGGTTAQQEIPAVRVGVEQMPLGIGIEMQTPRAHPPTPRLRVMDRRRPGSQRQHRVDRFSIREASTHGNHCSSTCGNSLDFHPQWGDESGLGTKGPAVKGFCIPQSLANRGF